MIEIAVKPFDGLRGERRLVEMISRLSLYNRMGVLCLPMLSFMAGCATLWICGGTWESGVAEDVLYFGQSRAFPVVAVAGLAVGLLDWFLPEKKTLLIFCAGIATLFSILIGWVLAQAIIHF